MSYVLKLFSCIRTSYLPALLMLVAALFCTLKQNLPAGEIRFYHILFFVLTALSAALYFFDKNKKDLLFVVLLFGFYVCLNHLKTLSGVSDVIEAAIMVLTPIFLCMAFFVKKEKISILTLLLFLVPVAVVENMASFDFSKQLYVFDFASIILWVLMFLLTLSRTSQYPSFKTSGLFFACLSVTLGVIFYQSGADLTIYFSAAAGTFFVCKIHQMIFEHYTDPVTLVSSVNSFERDELKKFPPKYSIAFFYVDNYAKLLKVFGQQQVDIFLKMILLKIDTLQLQTEIYRLSRSEFCLVFFETDVKETYEIMENIRRLIASTEFVTLKKKAIKLTITPVVSEKRRSDTDAKAVLLRMHENFRQKYKFTQNMTFCEEIQSNKKPRRSMLR
ncbi:MAG: diguanylate cyclase [Alphaproteobacteria bacterium]|nr:diguanylate cyclase [Alphaproteobacteria bacterium]